MAALVTQMPVTLREIAAKCNSKLVLVPTSNSALVFRKLARHLQAIPAVCRMHQYCLALAAPLKMSGMVSQFFCVSLLTKRHRVQSHLVRHFRGYIQNHLTIVHDSLSMNTLRMSAHW